MKNIVFKHITEDNETVYYLFNKQLYIAAESESWHFFLYISDVPNDEDIEGSMDFSENINFSPFNDHGFITYLFEDSKKNSNFNDEVLDKIKEMTEKAVEKFLIGKDPVINLNFLCDEISKEISKMAKNFILKNHFPEVNPETCDW